MKKILTNVFDCKDFFSHTWILWCFCCCCLKRLILFVRFHIPIWWMLLGLMMACDAEAVVKVTPFAYCCLHSDGSSRPQSSGKMSYRCLATEWFSCHRNAGWLWHLLFYFLFFWFKHSFFFFFFLLEGEKTGSLLNFINSVQNTAAH